MLFIEIYVRAALVASQKPYDGLLQQHPSKYSQKNLKKITQNNHAGQHKESQRPQNLCHMEEVQFIAHSGGLIERRAAICAHSMRLGQQRFPRLLFVKIDTIRTSRTSH
jgi:hypothetical protein